MMRSEMEQDILKVLVTEEELKARVAEMGEELYEKFQGKKPLFLGVLKGSFVFMTDLVRACQLKSDVEFIAVSSYGNATASSGRVQIDHDLRQDITGRHLIIAESRMSSTMMRCRPVMSCWRSWLIFTRPEVAVAFP